MNPVFVFLILIAALVIWVLLAGLYRIIGGFTNKFINNAKKAINDEPSKIDSFVDGFKSSFNKEGESNE